MSNAVTKTAMRRLPLGKFVDFQKIKDPKNGQESTLIVWSNHTNGKIEKYDSKTGERVWV